MHFRTGTAAALAAAIALSAQPVASLAGADQLSTYTTSFTEQLPLPSAGAYTGSLRLTIAPDGSVSGYYIPDDVTQFVPVVGDLKNGQLWLSVGQAGFTTIDATEQSDGSFVGSATQLGGFDEDAAAIGQPITYQFVAKLRTNATK